MHSAIRRRGTAVGVGRQPYCPAIARRRRWRRRRRSTTILTIVMLESPEAIENAEEIAEVDGVDVLFIGTSDLTAELGISGQMGHPKVIDAYQKVGDACRKHGKVLGMGRGVRRGECVPLCRDGRAVHPDRVRPQLYGHRGGSRVNFFNNLPTAPSATAASSAPAATKGKRKKDK